MIHEYETLPFYGPVTSRRSGLSLGVCLGNDKKACNWKCIYCQCKNARFQKENLYHHWNLIDLRPYAIQLIRSLPQLDSITIAGQIEPSLHPQLPEVIKWLIGIKAECGLKCKIEMLTNGSGLSLPKVRRACEQLDEVWVKLDAGDPETMYAINGLRSKNAVVRQIKLIKGLRKRYIQTMLINGPGALNNINKKSAGALLDAIVQCSPQQVNIVTLERTPALSKIKSVSKQVLKSFASRLSQEGIRAEIFPARKGKRYDFKIEHCSQDSKL